ncbi:FecR family protein [Akkermansiaceae bacterium]|nr:FecR family protein [Akkermansiaceae bacterium]
MREDFLRAVSIDAALQDEVTEMFEIADKSSSQNTGWKFAAIAATIALGAIGFAWWGLNATRNTPVLVAASSPAAIATLGDDRDCTWQGDVNAQSDKRLAPGLLELKSGVAVIEFDGGARLALRGPAALELIDPKAARLKYGTASVRCEEGLYSFSLLTPTSVVVDIGTEFGVAVEEDGASEIHVLDGEVEVTEIAGGENQHNRLLTEGNTLRMTPDGTGTDLEVSDRTWIRDYTTQADRAASAVTPRVIAHDWFPSEPRQKGRFSLGSGWGGAWWRSSRNPKQPFYFTGSGIFTPRHGELRLAMLVGGGVEVRRSLAEVIDPAKPQTIFLSFSLYRVTPARMDKTGKLSEAIVMLRSSSDPTSLLGLALSGRDHLVVLKRGELERSERQINGKRPQFVIARIEFHPTKGNRVSMVSYDQHSTIPTHEPSPGDWDLATRRQLAKIDAPLDRIALQVRKSAFKFGEINLGNSWEAVVNPEITEP